MTRLKIGLECEFFVKRISVESPPIGPLDPKLTPDDCGWLAEARGQAFYSPREAVFSLFADINRLETTADKLGVLLVKEPFLEVPRDVVLACRRAHAKGVLRYQNLYGYAEHKRPNRKTAGVHISFTQPREIRYPPVRGAPQIEVVNLIFDYVQIFRKLDAAFASEIKEAQRRPGFYELKCDGRIEYRSLPNNVNLLKVLSVLEDILQ